MSLYNGCIDVYVFVYDCRCVVLLCGSGCLYQLALLVSTILIFLYLFNIQVSHITLIVAAAFLYYTFKNSSLVFIGILSIAIAVLYKNIW